jgi:hypothetical protein
MYIHAPVAALLAMLACAACAQGDQDGPSKAPSPLVPSAMPSPVGVDDAPMCATDLGDVDGPTDEAQSALTLAQSLCVVGCAAAAGAGCAAVGTACTAGTIWTFGGIGVPCAYVVIAACGAAEGVGAACAIACTG